MTETTERIIEQPQTANWHNQLELEEKGEIIY